MDFKMHVFRDCCWCPGNGWRNVSTFEKFENYAARQWLDSSFDRISWQLAIPLDYFSEFEKTQPSLESSYHQSSRDIYELFLFSLFNELKVLSQICGLFVRISRKNIHINVTTHWWPKWRSSSLEQNSSSKRRYRILQLKHWGDI